MFRFLAILSTHCRGSQIKGVQKYLADQELRKVCHITALHASINELNTPYNHTSHITPHTSHIPHHTSHITHHTPNRMSLSCCGIACVRAVQTIFG